MECSLTKIKDMAKEKKNCLNPYSNGMLSDAYRYINGKQEFFVLILILMECSLTSKKAGLLY